MGLIYNLKISIRSRYCPICYANVQPQGRFHILAIRGQVSAEVAVESAATTYCHQLTIFATPLSKHATYCMRSTVLGPI